MLSILEATKPGAVFKLKMAPGFYAHGKKPSLLHFFYPPNIANFPAEDMETASEGESIIIYSHYPAISSQTDPVRSGQPGAVPLQIHSFQLLQIHPIPHLFYRSSPIPRLFCLHT